MSIFTDYTVEVLVPTKVFNAFGKTKEYTTDFAEAAYPAWDVDAIDRDEYTIAEIARFDRLDQALECEAKFEALVEKYTKLYNEKD